MVHSLTVSRDPDKEDCRRKIARYDYIIYEAALYIFR